MSESMRGETVAMWAQLAEVIQSAAASIVQSRQVIVVGSGVLTVTSGDPAKPATWQVAMAVGLAVSAGDTVLTLPVGGRETAIVVLATA